MVTLPRWLGNTGPVIWTSGKSCVLFWCRLDNPVAGWQCLGVPVEKLNRLREVLRSYESCLVAYSGGVDSVFLAHVAWSVLGERSLAVIADSPSLPRRELAEALAVGRQFGFPVRVIQTGEFDNAEYLSNPVNRCYFCRP